MKFDLTIWLSLVLFISFGINVFLFVYLRKAMTKLLFVSENLNDLVEIIKNYQKHLKQVYSLEMFYGDQTLEFLMSHTNSLLEILKDYEDVYSIALPLETQGEISFDREEENTDPEEEESTSPQISEENVFYTGSRRSNN